MNEADLYVVIRRPVPGNLKDKVRYLSLGFGWTTNPQLAMTFNSPVAAQRRLMGRVGEVVPARETPLQLTPEVKP